MAEEPNCFRRSAGHVKIRVAGGLAAITSQKTERVYPFEAIVEAPEGGLRYRSKVLLMQLRSIDKRRLRGRLGSVTAATMQRVDEALSVATGLVSL